MGDEGTLSPAAEGMGKHRVVNIIKAPHPIPVTRLAKVFLAGSIEMGTAVNWQSFVCEHLANANMLLLNPRRDDWDSSWEQSIENPEFVAQVIWELDAMERADIVLMHFEPGTKSPITLLELGLLKDNPGLVVHCPEGFWRKGNVDIVCQRYGVTQVKDIIELVHMAKSIRDEMM